MTEWLLRLRGGAWDGAEVGVEQKLLPDPDEGPPPRLYMYRCEHPSCVGHMEFDLAGCPLHSVLVYNRESMSTESRTARYVHGDTEPGQEREHLVELIAQPAGLTPRS